MGYRSFLIMGNSKNEKWQEGKGEDEHRHRCLVRWVIRKRIEDRDRALEWLRGWNKKHPGSILESDVIEQWQKGNRGQQGEWK